MKPMHNSSAAQTQPQRQIKQYLERVSRLRPHPVAQRDLQPDTLRKIGGANFNINSVGQLSIVQYKIENDDGPWIVDGHHRQNVMNELGYADYMVPVELHLYVKDDAAACRLFLELNQRGTVRPFFKFRAALKAGMPGPVAIAKVVKFYGLGIDQASKDGYICCVSSLERIYRYDDTGVTLSTALSIATNAWGLTANAVEGRIIEGLGLLVKTYGDQIDAPALIKKLAQYPGAPAALLGDARNLRKSLHASIPYCMAQQMIIAYNQGRRSGKLTHL